ncbi:MAG: AAA family ATPase [Vigna little leaf phytoplasma]|nr:AAA family ATPase [Vigna little leaf phytoplasma]
MTLLAKIYYCLLGLLGLVTLGVLSYGVSFQPITQSPTKVTEKQSQLDATTQQELTQIKKHLQVLETKNQQQIALNNQRKVQDENLARQIDTNLGLMKGWDAQIKKLQEEITQIDNDLQKDTQRAQQITALETEIATLEKKLAQAELEAAAKNQLQETIQAKKEALQELTPYQSFSPEEQQQLEKQKQAKKEIEQQLSTQKTTLEQQTALLVEERKKIQLTPLTKEVNEPLPFLVPAGNKLPELTEEIKDLEEAIRYNEVNQRTIQKLFADQKDEAERHKLTNYRLFLESQLFIFEKRIKTLQEMIQAIQQNQALPTKKKKKNFASVYGMTEEKEQFADLIHYFNAPKHVLGYQNVKPTGVLLYGPPGTGKSHLIEALCGETGVHYIEFEPSRLDKTYVGEGNEELEKIWAEAEAYEKTIIFIDEISGLANRENKNTNQTANNIINNLLTKLDGFKRSDHKIILMGATNHLDQIDSALRSRFQQEIKIDSFKKEEIPGFLKFLILNNHYRISFHTLNHLETLVQRVPADKELSNRDWVKLLNRAFLIYDRLAFEHDDHEVMLPSDLDEALDQMLEIKRSTTEIQKQRQACEAQYRAWKAGFVTDIAYRDRTKVERTYTFERFNGLTNCQYPDKVPKELNSFVQNKPFSEWYHEWDQRGIDNNWIPTKNEAFYKIPPTLETDKNASLLTKENISDEGIMIYKHANTINLLYNGPKYVLDRDQDFYLCEIPIPFRDLDKTFFDDRYYTQNYYLHFNPVKNYLTLYTEPMKMNENEQK